MIWSIFIEAVTWLLNGIFSFLPAVTVLPFGIDSALVTAFGYWNGFLAVFWPLAIVWTMAVWFYGIKFALLFIRMIPFIGRAVV